MKRFGRLGTIGVTIGTTEVVAARLDAAAWSRAIAPFADGATRWPALEAALCELRDTYASRGTTLAVALLPPLADVRPVTLPPLSDDEARRVLLRHAARYFVGAREPQVVGVRRAPGSAGKDSGPRTVIAAAAPARALEAIQAAARDAGWHVQSVVPATAAWHACALTVWPDLRRGHRDVVVVRGGGTELLQLRDGAIVAVRRFGERSGSMATLREALARDGAKPSEGRALLGPLALRDALQHSLNGSAAPVLAPPARWEAVAESAERAAATFAARSPDLELVSESIRRARGVRRRRMTVMIAAAAAVLLIVAAGIELWAARRELARVRAERAALHPRIAGLVAIRDSAAVTGLRLRELGAATDRAVPWSDVLAAVTAALPRDAYLSAFRADGDSLVIEGVAHRAAGVFAAMHDADRFDGVRSAAPVRRDLGDRQATEAPERFAVAARVAPAQDTGLALGAAGRWR